LYDDEHVKLADFGIARLFGTTSLTTAGGVLGTADYMSPEQADGRPVTARCDQYSLGGVMYALLAGRPPFRAKNLPQMLQLQRFAKPEPVRRYAPDTPEQLEHVIMQLLAKEPSERFPNTQVLARHLQAMVNALSRPAADDFALASDMPGSANAFTAAQESMSAQVTQAEVEVERPRTDRSVTVSPNRTVNLQASQNAATLAAEQAVSRQSPSNTSAKTSFVAAASAEMSPLERPTRFTTVEEEESRLRSQSQRSWIVVAAQLGSLAAVLALLAGGAAYLSRPLSADKLYSMIDARVERNDDASIAKVESEVNEFLERFPDDARANTLRKYKERIDLAKLERKLQRQTRGGGVDSTLLPAEQLYLQASAMAGTDPAKSLLIFESLINLYEPKTAATTTAEAPATIEKTRDDRPASERTADVVQLAKRRVEKLRPDVARQNEQLLRTLEERLAAAEELMSTDPTRAAAIYQAIVTLHQDDTWAAPVVEQAREKLARAKK
jgi:serine/threonine-protein kinase